MAELTPLSFDAPTVILRAICDLDPRPFR